MEGETKNGRERKKKDTENTMINLYPFYELSYFLSSHFSIYFKTYI